MLLAFMSIHEITGITRSFLWLSLHPCTFNPDPLFSWYPSQILLSCLSHLHLFLHRTNSFCLSLVSLSSAGYSWNGITFTDRRRRVKRMKTEKKRMWAETHAKNFGMHRRGRQVCMRQRNLCLCFFYASLPCILVVGGMNNSYCLNESMQMTLPLPLINCKWN